MAFAQGSRSSLGLGVEATFGGTVSSYTNLPFKSHSLDFTKERLQGQDIQSDRMPRVDRHGNSTVSGSVEVDLRKGNYDDLLESAFLSTFDTNDIIEVGTTPKFLAIEDAANDVAQFRKFTGLSVNSASFSLAPNQMIETTFDLVGKGMTQSGSGVTVGASTINPPFDSYNGNVFEGGVTSGSKICIVSALNFSITNGFAPEFVVACDANVGTAAALSYGRSTVEGTMTVYYEDATLINKFLNETESELQVSVAEPGGSNPYTFYFPRIKYNGATAVVADENSRFIELPFIALYDSGEGTQLRLTKS